MYFINTGIRGTVGLKTLSFSKVRNLLSVGFHVLSWFLMVLRGTLSH
jgi:hypothetical protein